MAETENQSNKNKHGRPKSKIKKDRVLRFRVTAEEQEQVKQIALDKNMSLSKFFRSLIWEETENSENEI